MQKKTNISKTDRVLRRRYKSDKKCSEAELPSGQKLKYYEISLICVTFHICLETQIQNKHFNVIETKMPMLLRHSDPSRS